MWSNIGVGAIFSSRWIRNEIINQYDTINILLFEQTIQKEYKWMEVYLQKCLFCTCVVFKVPLEACERFSFWRGLWRFGRIIRYVCMSSSKHRTLCCIVFNVIWGLTFVSNDTVYCPIRLFHLMVHLHQRSVLLSQFCQNMYHVCKS